MKKLFFLTFILLNFLAKASQNKKVLIIGLDGTRSDALQQANTPNLDALIANGLFTWDAWHLGITVSGPSWSTIMTGVWWNKHGVSSNAYTGSNFNQYPYFPTLAKTILPNLKCVQVVEWAPMSDNVYNDGWDTKLITPDGDGAATAAVASAQLADDNLDCMFVYFDAVDLAGHSSGFSPSNPSYIQAIENNDYHMGLVLNALYARPNYANEDWLILVITDHGGIGTGHGGITYEERHIWWVASGASVTQQQLTASDPGTYNLLGTGIFNPNGVNQTLLKQSPVQADIAVTALHHLLYTTGINPETYPSFNLDGKSWLNVFSNIENQMKDNVKLFPNPTSSTVTLWFENTSNTKPLIKVTDITGKMVEWPSFLHSDNKVTLNTEHSPAGQYLVQITTNAGTVSRQVMVSR